MAIDGKVLSQGFVPSTKSSLYTVPSGSSRAYIKFFSLFNSGSVTQDIFVYVSGSMSTTFGRVQLAPSESAWVLDETLLLNSQYKIEAKADVDSAIEYVIMGGLE